MLETCRGGPGHISLSVKKTQNFERASFPNFEAPTVEGLPYMLETCWEGPKPIWLCVEKTKNFDQIPPPQTLKQKWTKILTGPFSTNLKHLE